MSRIILCNAMPLKILGVYYEKTLIFEYISESKSHIDNVLSPTNA